MSGDGDGVERRPSEDGTTLSAERILVATGRHTDPGAVGLGSVGVPEDAKVAPIDERCRVTPKVWAIGDLTGKGAFTHVSMYQAGIVIRDVLGRGRARRGLRGGAARDVHGPRDRLPSA